MMLLTRLILCFTLASTASTASFKCPVERPVPTGRFMFFNILHGGEDRLDRIVNYVRDSQLDFLGLSELNHFSDRKLQQFGASVGMPHTYFLYAKSGYHLGVVSKHPFDMISKETEELWHHGHIYVYLKALKVSIFVTHLSPHKSTVRRWEASKILETWQREMAPLLVLGDLNTLSPLYAAEHATLRSLFLSDPRLSKKFLDAEQNIDYVPMRMLLTELHDAGLGTSGYTVPTDLTDDSMHAARMRLDYALSSEKNRYIARTDDAQRTLSDHFPLVVQRCDFAQLKSGQEL